MPFTRRCWWISIIWIWRVLAAAKFVRHPVFIFQCNLLSCIRHFVNYLLWTASSLGNLCVFVFSFAEVGLVIFQQVWEHHQHKPTVKLADIKNIYIITVHLITRFTWTTRSCFKAMDISDFTTWRNHEVSYWRLVVRQSWTDAKQQRPCRTLWSKRTG